MGPARPRTQLFHRRDDRERVPLGAFELTARAVLPILRDGAASTALQYAPKHHAGRAEHRERGDPDDSLCRDRLGCFFIMRIMSS